MSNVRSKAILIKETASALGASSRTIDRKLRLIRAIWEEAAG